MEIYSAIASFEPPDDSRGHNILAFQKGDRFEALESCELRVKKIWWGVRYIYDNPNNNTSGIDRKDLIGFVPASYLKFEERLVLNNLTSKEKLRRQATLDQFKNMERVHRDSDDRFVPEADYDPNPVRSHGGSLLLQSGHRPQAYHGPSSVPAPLSPARSPKLPRSNSRNTAVNGPQVSKSPEIARRANLVAPGLVSPSSPGLLRRAPSLVTPTSPCQVRSAPPSIDPRILEDRTDPSLLIQPKKLANPCMESKDKQDLHRELLFNQKRGVDPLHQKSELQREMTRRQQVTKKKELDHHQQNKRRDSFQTQLQKQAEKYDEYEKEQEQMAKDATLPEAEFLKIHARIHKPNSSESVNS